MPLFSRDYRRPFWRGFFHALAVVIYSTFITLVFISLETLYDGDIAPVIQLVFSLFLVIISISVCAYLIFFEPIKKTLHKHYRAANTMLWSTFGWLFIFVIIFLIGLVLTIGESPFVINVNF